MIHFMIDFENVKSGGLAGSEYLCAYDRMTIFYSVCCQYIESKRMRQIRDAGCELDICRVQNNGKNALDFYIASKIGELYGSGYKGDIAIVSNDKGFRAVQEYWSGSFEDRKIVLKPNLEQCILFSGESSVRRRLIQDKRKKVHIESEFQKYQEKEPGLLNCCCETGKEFGCIRLLIKQKKGRESEEL